MHARVRLALLALVVVACGAVAPSQASAAVSWFTCDSQPSHQWCNGQGNGSFDGEDSWNYVEGWNNSGGGLFWVCQRVYKPSTGTWLTGDGCGQNWTGHYYGNVVCVCYEAQVQQTSGSAKSIGGYADPDATGL